MGRLGPYRILKVLGTGAMGVVFQAEDPQLKRIVALKVMRPSLAASAECHRRFLREARLAAAIDHEHVVTIYQVGEDRGVPFLAMQMLQGETARRAAETRRAAGCRWPRCCASAGRSPRDWRRPTRAASSTATSSRPTSGWRRTRGRVKILDFGLARGSEPDAQLTQAGP